MIGAYAIGSTTIAGSAAGGAVGHGDAAMIVTLPALTGVMAGATPDFAQVAVVLPALTAVFIASAPATGRMVATLPALTADIQGTAPVSPARYSWLQCPRPASGFAMKGRVGTLRSDGGQPE